MKLLIFIFIFSLPATGFGQDCNCKSDFIWVKKTFEENDAGYKYSLSLKGEEAYKNHSKVYLEKVANIDDHNQCLNAIYEWMTFFRNGHIGIQSLKQQINNDSKSSVDQIRSQYADWETTNINLDKFKRRISNNDGTDFEGIWESGPYRIGINKVGDDYVGFIIEADGVYWVKNQVKLRIHSDNSATFYMRDHSAREFEKAEIIGNNYLEIGTVRLKRAEPKLKSNENVSRYFQLIEATDPLFQIINDNTVLIRIPSFNFSSKSKIDSVISSNQDKLYSKPNLIIDIRDNGGGTDRSYKKLLPLLYTNPIRTIGVEYYSTPLNNKRVLDFINDPKYNLSEEEKLFAQKSYELLSDNIGEFVTLSDDWIDITEFDQVLPYPKKVAILINEKNGSTAEQFLLAAKQSQKVKLYGNSTLGVLDFSNVYGVVSPCGDFKIFYTLSRSKRIPEMAIDGIGIQPDFYIDKTIPKYEWINFVTKVLDK